MTSVNLQLKRRITDYASIRWYALYGPAGVISWGITTWGGYCPVGVHSPRPLWERQDTASGCPFLELACYFDPGDLAVGEGVGDRWTAAGRDDEVVWRALAEAYGGRLGGRRGWMVLDHRPTWTEQNR